MITKAAQVVNAATRGRWSTVILLTLIFTSMRAVVDWDMMLSDFSLFFAKLLTTLIISAIISFIIHVILYVIFSPKATELEQVFEKPVDLPEDNITVVGSAFGKKKAVKQTAKRAVRAAAKKKRR